MVVSLTKFFGDGYDHGAVVGNTLLPYGNVRVITIDGGSIGPLLRLGPTPNDLSGINAVLRTAGFPQYLIVNVGAQTVGIAPWLGAPTIINLPGSKCAYFGFTYTTGISGEPYRWYSSEPKDFQKGSDIV